MLPAFALSPGLSCKSVNRARQCARRPRHLRMEVSGGELIVQGAALLTLVGSVVYVARTIQTVQAEQNAESNGASPVSSNSAPAAKPDEGILGLMGGSRSVPRAASFSSNSVVPRSKPVVQAAQAITDPVAEAEERRCEELSWAFAALSDLGMVSTMMIGANGTVLRSEGDLIQAGDKSGEIVERVSQLREQEIMNVTGNEQFPFLDKAVRSVACYPVGDSGAVLVLAAAESDFFGELENRVAGAVAARLAAFVGSPVEVELPR